MDIILPSYPPRFEPVKQPNVRAVIPPTARCSFESGGKENEMKRIKINFNDLPKYIGDTRTIEKFGNTIERRDYKTTDAQAVRHFINEYLRDYDGREIHIIVEGKLPAWMWLHIADELHGIEHLTWTSVGSVADVEIY